jgi:hypothetical protein
VRLGKAVINISPQGMQRHLPLMRNLAAGYLGTTQPAGAAYSYPLSPGLRGAEYCLLHCPAEGNAMLNLVGDCPGYQIGIKLRLLNLKDVELNPLPDKALKAAPQLVNSLPSPPDDHARACGVNGYRHLIRLALNLHIGDGGFGTYRLDSLAELQVLV